MISPYLPKNERTAVPRFAPWPGAVTELASIDLEGACRKQTAPGEFLRGPLITLLAERVPARILLDRDGLVVRQLPVLHEEAAELVGRDVAVLVDRVRAKHRLLVLGLEHLVDDRGAVVTVCARTLHRVEHEAHGLVPVDGVRLRLTTAVLGLEVLEELLTFRRVVLRVDRADRDVRVLLRIGRHLRGEGVLRHAVRTEQLDVRLVRCPDVLVQLDAVRGRDAAEEERVSTARLDLRRESAVVRRLDVDALVADDLDAVHLGGITGGLGNARTVDLLVVGDEELRHAKLLHPGTLNGALDVVRGHDTRVGALAGRVVLARRTLAARARVLSQLERRVRRADLHEAGLVGDWNRDRGSARVELTDVADNRLVLRGLPRIARGLARIPLTRLGSRVIELLEADRAGSDLVVDLRQGEFLALHHVFGLLTIGCVERKARDELD